MSGQPYDSAPETLAHARRVGDFLALAAAEIVKRAAKHDHSKVCAPARTTMCWRRPRPTSGTRYATPWTTSKRSRVARAARATMDSAPALMSDTPFARSLNDLARALAELEADK